MRTVVVAILLSLAGSAVAEDALTTEQDFAAAMQGCWVQTKWELHLEKRRRGPNYLLAHQFCLEAGVAGDATGMACEVDDCWEYPFSYSFRDMKFWREYGDTPPIGTSSCDVALVLGKEFRLYNCIDHAKDNSPFFGGTYSRVADK